MLSPAATASPGPTAYRYLEEVITVLAEQAPELTAALEVRQ
jgi:hypothetical protein